MGLSISLGGEVLVLKNFPSPMYSYCEKGLNLFLYSDLCSLKLVYHHVAAFSMTKDMLFPFGFVSCLLIFSKLSPNFVIFLFAL